MPLFQSHPAEEPSLLHFAQHLSYPLLEQWISQGLLALANAERQGTLASVFTSPAATDHFGINPTMIQSLRFWLRATGVMIEQRQQSARRLPVLTSWGRLLAQADPYLMRPGSIWGLHAHLARNRREAPAFAWFFQHFGEPGRLFTKQECLTRFHSWAITQAPTQRIRPRALRNDLACLLRMYLPERLLSPEQALSPFRRLGLLSLLPKPATQLPATYVLQRGQPPALLVLAMLLEQETGKPHLLRDLVHKPGGVGTHVWAKRIDVAEHLLPDPCGSPRLVSFPPTHGTSRVGHASHCRVA